MSIKRKHTPDETEFMCFRVYKDLFTSEFKFIHINDISSITKDPMLGNEDLIRIEFKDNICRPLKLRMSQLSDEFKAYMSKHTIMAEKDT